MNGFHIVIPVRYGSTRLPAKPLLELGGKPMIDHVVDCARRSDAIGVVVATDDRRIARVCEKLEVQTMMTASEHRSGTERIHEVAQRLGWPGDTVIVNLQGDEPRMPPQVINQVARLLYEDAQYLVATLYAKIEHDSDVFDPNVVKLVSDDKDRAMYFSRAPVPWDREEFPTRATTARPASIWKRHIGLYAYRKRALDEFIQLTPSPLEHTEQLEQLRFLDHGIPITAAEACQPVPSGVDTQADLERERTKFS